MAWPTFSRSSRRCISASTKTLVGHAGQGLAAEPGRCTSQPLSHGGETLMADTFRAFVVDQVDGEVHRRLPRSRRCPGSAATEKVLVDVAYSSLETTRTGSPSPAEGKIVEQVSHGLRHRSSPAPVAESADPHFKKGDKVVALGAGQSESAVGAATAQRMQVKPEMLIKIPAPLSPPRNGHGHRHRGLHRHDRGDGPGTRRHHAGQRRNRGNGRGGGSSGRSASRCAWRSSAIKVVASTGRAETHDYLQNALGAAEIIGAFR